MVSLANVDEDARRGRGPLRAVTGSGVMRLPARLMGSTAGQNVGSHRLQNQALQPSAQIQTKGAEACSSIALQHVLKESSIFKGQYCDSQTARPTTVSGKNICMPSVFCQLSMRESMPAVRMSSMSEQVNTGTSHDLHRGAAQCKLSGVL